jgi:DNA-binding NtrC family response regulator
MAARDVLIVEEDRGLGEVLHQVFLAAGYNCVLAGDGHEGLEVFRRSHPALIVTARAGHALTAPHHRHVSGIDLLLQVRQEDPDVAVIVLAGASDVKTLVECLKLGAHAYIMKPINVDQLLIAADRAFERRQLIIEHRQHQQADRHLQDTDRTTLGRPDLVPRDILIVEEDRKVREVLHQVFLAAGYNCLLANDGREGLEVFRGSRPPLIVTDLNLPVMSGMELLKQVCQEDPGVAVIVLARASDVKTLVECLKLGAHAVLWKPVVNDELLITAKRALERRQLLIERRQRQDRLARPNSQRGA